MPKPRRSPKTETVRTSSLAEYIKREDALQLLDVKPQTFYTYVSRGYIQRIAQPGRKEKLYRRSDVERMAANSQAKHVAGARAASALRFGEPVVQTWITEIKPNGPCYRKRPAVDLATAQRSFEAVAELLWLGVAKATDSPWKIEELPPGFLAWTSELHRQHGTGSPLDLFSVLIAVLRALDGREADADHANTVPVAHRILQVFTGVSGFIGPSRCFEPPRDGEFLAECVARGLGVGSDDRAIAAINAALVLCADHELAAPTFAARVCASTGADLHACVATGVFVHSGSLQGGGTDGAEDFMDALLRPRQPARHWQPDGTARGEWPGFNHPLYHRDPRAVALLELAKASPALDPDAERLLQLVETIERERNFFPNVVAALVILSRAFRLPRRTANLLMGLGRTAGWIAHALEQRIAGFMLRPRAKYMGPSQQDT